MKVLYTFIAVLFTVCSAFAQGNALSTKVNTESGPIEGYESDGMMIYKGIPFAAPPVGDLRWKAPQPVKPWTETLMTKKALFRAILHLTSARTVFISMCGAQPRIPMRSCLYSYGYTVAVSRSAPPLTLTTIVKPWHARVASSWQASIIELVNSVSLLSLN